MGVGSDLYNDREKCGARQNLRQVSGQMTSFMVRMVRLHCSSGNNARKYFSPNSVACQAFCKYQVRLRGIFSTVHLSLCLNDYIVSFALRSVYLFLRIMIARIEVHEDIKGER